MRRLLVPLGCLLLPLLPASAQFEVLDPEQVVLPAAGGELFAGQYDEYVWTPAAVRTRMRGDSRELLLIEQGTGKTKEAPVAIAVRRLGGGLNGLRQLTLPLLLAGQFDTLLTADFTGDGDDELLIRCEVVSSGATDGPVVPYSGKKPEKGTVVNRTTVIAWTESAPVTLLLQQDAPPEVTEYPGVLPTATGNDLVIASFGGHAGGATAAPDAWLRYSFASSGEGTALVRQPDLVMTPVPIVKLVTADLAGDGTRRLISLRAFPEETYKQQLWAQQPTAKGFFENAAIGRGNDLQLVPVHPDIPGVHFLWNDAKSKVPRSHLTSLRLDASGKPKQHVDLALPAIVALRGAAWGRTRPFQTLPQLALLLRPAALDETWLATATWSDRDAVPTLTITSHPALTGLTSLAAIDLNADGYDEWIGASPKGLVAYDPLRETMLTRIDIAPLGDEPTELFSLIPEEIEAGPDN